MYSREIIVIKMLLERLPAPKRIEFVKLHLNVRFLLVFLLWAHCALLLFHERDLAVMKPTDVIAPLFPSIEFIVSLMLVCV